MSVNHQSGSQSFQTPACDLREMGSARVKVTRKSGLFCKSEADLTAALLVLERYSANHLAQTEGNHEAYSWSSKIERSHDDRRIGDCGHAGVGGRHRTGAPSPERMPSTSMPQ